VDGVSIALAAGVDLSVLSDPLISQIAVLERTNYVSIVRAKYAE
jgi:hypothetical protein